MSFVSILEFNCKFELNNVLSVYSYCFVVFIKAILDFMVDEIESK